MPAKGSKHESLEKMVAITAVIARHQNSVPRQVLQVSSLIPCLPASGKVSLANIDRFSVPE